MNVALPVDLQSIILPLCCDCLQNNIEHAIKQIVLYITARKSVRSPPVNFLLILELLFSKTHEMNYARKSEIQWPIAPPEMT